MLRHTTQNTLALRRGRQLELATLSWNVAGIVVLAIAAVRARSVALAGFGLDSLIEIGASTVVLWELAGANEERRRRALRLIGAAFMTLVTYLSVQASFLLATGYHARHSALGLAWTAATAIVMLGLARGKHRTGTALDNPVLLSEGRVTLIDAGLACAVLIGLGLNTWLNWWWADPVSAYFLVFYGGKEAIGIFRGDPDQVRADLSVADTCD